jgi:hypothetical protein
MSNPEVMPTANDKEHIMPLAQKLMDTAQEYARDNGMTLQGVMSAIGTMTGAMLSRAYADPELAKSVAGRIGIAALAMIDVMHANDPLIRARRH